jgi:type II secretory ATPase GspE/PulE/Tfp pilus assembly ATPase PilB-like protein
MSSELQVRLDALAAAGAERTTQIVDAVLADAVRRLASDVHFEPTPRALEVRYRLDGVPHTVAIVRRELTTNIVARLKVLAELLTYRVDVPQEGGVRPEHNRHGADMRVSTFPTVHGEKAAVRIFTTAGRPLELDELGLPTETRDALAALLPGRPAGRGDPGAGRPGGPGGVCRPGRPADAVGRREGGGRPGTDHDAGDRAHPRAAPGPPVTDSP